jgi:hypothetical protein
MPVYWWAPHRGYDEGKFKKNWMREISYLTGLLLQSRPNGQLVRVGLLHDASRRDFTELAVVLDALQKIKPGFVMMS